MGLKISFFYLFKLDMDEEACLPWGSGTWTYEVSTIKTCLPRKLNGMVHGMYCILCIILYFEN